MLITLSLIFTTLHSEHKQDHCFFFFITIKGPHRQSMYQFGHQTVYLSVTTGGLVWRQALVVKQCMACSLRSNWQWSLFIPWGQWTGCRPGLHNFHSGLQTVNHYISAWISETPLTFMLELVVSFIFVVNNPSLCNIGSEIFNWKYWFANLLGPWVRSVED